MRDTSDARLKEIFDKDLPLDEDKARILIATCNKSDQPKLEFANITSWLSGEAPEPLERLLKQALGKIGLRPSTLTQPL